VWVGERRNVREARRGEPLGTEAVQGLASALEGVDNVERGDSLALGVLGVGDRVADDVLEEDLEDATGLLVDEARDTLDTATTSETTDRGLGDALDVVTQLQVDG
jgi:hypothetical protein